MADEIHVSGHKSPPLNNGDNHTIDTISTSVPTDGSFKTRKDGNPPSESEPEYEADTTIDSTLTSNNEANISASTQDIDNGSDEELNVEEEDEEEQEPPKLKYTRLNKLPSSFFGRDAVSTCFFHESVFLFATHSGLIHIANPDLTAIRTFKGHRGSVLSLYTDGQYFASGSMDGTIVIGSFKDEKDIVAFDFKRPIHAVILDKNYQKTRSFISGGMSGKVIYSSKSWLGQRSDVILDQGNGPIVSLQHIDDLIIWMNDSGINVYHTSTRKIISKIEKPEGSPRSDLYWPRVHFPETDRIVIAWANHIWSLRVSLRSSDDINESTPSNKSRTLPSSATISFRAVQEKKIEVEHVFRLDTLIAGIASFKDDTWMLLIYNEPGRDSETNKVTFPAPDLKLMNSITGDIELEEEIGLKDIQGLGLNDYLLGSYIGSKTPQYYIMCAKDGVVAQETQLDDHLKWYIERKRFLDAWRISQHLVSPIKRLTYGIQYVDGLMKLDDWDEASKYLAKFLYLDTNDLPESDTKSTIVTNRSDASQSEEREIFIKEITSQWTIWSGIFIQSGHVEQLTKIIPTDAKLNLPQFVFNSILEYWLTQIDNKERFYQLIGDWDVDLYDIKLIQSKLEELLERQISNNKLRRCLVDLFVKSHNPSKAAPHLIALNDPQIISFLASHHILTSYINELPKIITLGLEEKEVETLPVHELGSKLEDRIDILVKNRHELPPASIIESMNKNHLDFISYFYLENLSVTDDYLTYPFGNERIKLYALYNRPQLLPFLTKYSNYDIDEAISLCETNNFTEELVHLLGKIGENRKALQLIINELDDPEKAIKFAKHQNDKEAWSILLDYSVSKPNFIKALIECADDQSNSYYDPVSILERMPSDVEIEGLKESVTKISSSNDLNLILNQLILKTVYKQSEEVSSLYKQQELKGIEFEINESPFLEYIKHFETLLLYKEPSDMKANLLEESELLKEKASAMHNKTHVGMESKLDHLSKVKTLIEHRN